MTSKEYSLVCTNIQDLLKRQPDLTTVETIEKATTEFLKK
jgi:hypothetical protein